MLASVIDSFTTCCRSVVIMKLLQVFGCVKSIAFSICVSHFYTIVSC
jgi:hypothetical protein